MNYAMLLARGRRAIAGGSQSPASGEGWDVSTAEFSQSFSVASQETRPFDIFFDPAGVKMYVCGTSSDSIIQYGLSVAWDISTASYAQSFSVASQSPNPLGIFFKPDGLKVYVVSATSDDISRYDLSVAWDISTASYVQSFSVASQSLNPLDILFKPDGLKMWMTENAGQIIYEYSIGTAWDISTASYAQIFYRSAGNIFLKSDGGAMYLRDSSGNTRKISQYSLSSEWDIGSASYVNAFNILAQDDIPRGVFFKPDGLKMYHVGEVGDSVYEYNLAPV